MAKLGPHVILTTADALAFTRAAPIVKAIDNVDVLRAARPDAVRIHRHFFAHQDLDRPHVAAEAILQSLQEYRHPLLYAEVYNEIGKGDRDRYITFLQQTIPLLHAAGVRVAGPSWATGDYEQADWDAFRAARWAGLDLVSLHAYWGNQGFTQWHALRYRTYWRADDPNVVITECGRDRVEGGRGGWIADGLTAEAAATEFVAYDAETAKDDYVVGVTPFTWGPTPDWADGYHNDLLTAPLMARLAQEPQPAPGGNVITSAEFERLVKDCFDRAQVPYNPTSAFVKYFAAQLRAGTYIGAPEEPEHDSEDKTLVLQRFAGRYLWLRKSDMIVHETALPFH